MFILISILFSIVNIHFDILFIMQSLVIICLSYQVN